MSCSNLAICIGPNLLSPPEEDLLPLEALLEVTEKVKALVEFLMENCRELFGEESAEPWCAAGEEWPAPVPRCRDVRLEEQGVPAGTAAAEQEAEGLPQAGPSPLGVLKEAGGERVVACETGEAPPALPPSSPESAADSLGCPQEPASLSEERRFAGCAQDKAKRRKRKSKQAWGEESARRAAKKRRKREAVLADGAVQRRRKAQQVRKARR
ncbi:uncharacterized protein LOC127028221 [Gymnogyps californianus]|uniref:uncharacterized protein LOC127028221 n=1 Tax=Gymnogyps californianus TaxID=33616 RepID=UPI0021C90E55|nr:uncharacterized protein LOC127028221 [Gymnogyps californianus]